MCAVGENVCTSAVERNKDAFQHNGRVEPAMAQTVERMLASFNPAVADAKVDLNATYTDAYLA